MNNFMYFGEQKVFNIVFAVELFFYKLFRKNFSAQLVKISSSICAVIGGIMLAAKLHISSHGFLFFLKDTASHIALSSSQILISSIQNQDNLMMFYSGSIFLFVDCLGVYRWLLT